MGEEVKVEAFKKFLRILGTKAIVSSEGIFTKYSLHQLSGDSIMHSAAAGKVTTKTELHCM